MNKTTNWVAYNEFGSFYRLKKGLLQFAPMFEDGSMDTDNIGDVEFENISEQEVVECDKIINQLNNA